MKRHSILIIILLSIHWIIGCDLLYSQNTSNSTFSIPDKNYFDLKMDSTISKEVYLDPKEEIKIVFIFKIDSLGEVHSAHIRWSKNLKSEHFYNICNDIESNFYIKFLFDEYKSRFVGSKYVFCTYSYSNIRK